MKNGARGHLLATVALLALNACGRQAQNDEAHLALGTLDPSDPAQLAVIHWHAALLANDFGTYNSVAVWGTDDSSELRKVVFEALRPGVPKEVFARDSSHNFDGLSPASDEALKGLRTFALVGCTEGATNASPERMMAVVSVRKIEGNWRVYGGSFGKPSTPFAGRCPVVPGT